MGAKSEALAEDILQAVLDGTTFPTAIAASALKARLGTGLTAVTNQLTGYLTDLGEASFQSTGGAGTNWTIGATASTGQDATNLRVLGNGTSEWNNTGTGTKNPTHIAIYSTTGGAVGNLLYAGELDGTPAVGEDAIATIAISGLVIGEL